MNEGTGSDRKKRLMKAVVFLGYILPLYSYSILTGLPLTCSGALWFVILNIPVAIFLILFRDRKKANQYALYIMLILLALLVFELIYVQCM